MISPTNPDFSEMRVSQNDRKGKNAEQMLHDANDAKELSDDWERAKDLCYEDVYKRQAILSTVAGMRKNE